MGNESTNSKERQGIRALLERVPVLGGVKALREGGVDAIAGEGDGASAKSKSGWGGGGFSSGDFGGGGF